MKIQMDHVLVSPDDSIRQAVACIDRNRHGLGIALVVDEGRHLLGTITDGDVRRAMLAGLALEAAVHEILAQKARSRYPTAVTARVGTSPEDLLQLMEGRAVSQVPLLDAEGCVADLVLLSDLLPAETLRMQAVIMAGGSGTRLRPLTEDLPKPMLPVGGRPLMERIVGQLQQAGIRQVNVTTHYKADKIIEHFGDGRTFGVDLKYVNEDRPLGTGGGLGLMSPPAETQLVINGDIVTEIDFRAMLAFHRDNSAEMTVAVRKYEVQVPYGVVECDGARIRGVQEKPQLGFFVNAGIYLLEPSVYQFIPNGESFNMTDLIHWLLDAGRVIVSFPIREYWLDIGQQADYAQAQHDALHGKVTE